MEEEKEPRHISQQIADQKTIFQRQGVCISIILIT